MTPDSLPPPAFRLEFGTVAAGWIEARARLGPNTIETRASYLSEPLADWIEACLELKRHVAGNHVSPSCPAREVVDWVSEPAVHRFTLEVADRSLLVKLSCLWASDPPSGPWREHDRDFGSIFLPWHELAAEVCRARRTGLAWSRGRFR